MLLILDPTEPHLPVPPKRILVIYGQILSGGNNDRVAEGVLAP